MNEPKKPSIMTGALVGLLLTAPAVAVLFLVSQISELSFAPYDVFDSIGKVQFLGPVITFGIDTMVSIIRGLNLGETSSTAQSIENLLAIAGFFVTGIVAGSLLFYLLNRRNDYQPSYLPGVILGALVGVPVILMSDHLNNFLFSTNPTLRMANAIWFLLVFLVWGASFSRIYDNLRVLPEKKAVGTAEASVIDRRQFMVHVGGATATLTVIGAGLGALLKTREEASVVALLPDNSSLVLTDGTGRQLPNADDPLIPALGTRPEYTPLDKHYNIDIVSAPLVIDEETWELEITGLVENPVKLSLADIRQMESMDQYVTLACISNPLGGDLTSTVRWTGVNFQKFMELVKPTSTATHVRITSADGFDEIMDLSVAQQDERVMLAYAWDGVPLKAKHGFPLRIYIPDRFGMKQPKWMVKMEFIDRWEEGYWVRRGWSKEAIMVATSVIDTVATNAIIQNGSQMYVPVGGMAHAGARGISKVQVKVNDGKWVDAQLRSPMSETTWVIWRYDWPFEEGQHTFFVRCLEGDGTPQIESVRGNRPDGATGIDAFGKDIMKPAASA